MNKLFFLSLIVLVSCSSLNTVVSGPETLDNTGEYRYSDPDSRIRYKVTNDKERLHITLNTTDASSITKILKTGLTIYFDTKGKKSDDVYFQFPITQDRELSVKDKSKKGGFQPEKFDLTRIIAKIPNDAVFSSFGIEDRFNVLLAVSDIKASLKAVNKSELTYDLIIPFSRISGDDFSSLSNLSIGVVSGKFDAPHEAGKAGEGGQAGGGQGGGMPGSLPGGVKSGGMSGGLDHSSMTKEFKFWFLVDLHDDQ